MSLVVWSEPTDELPIVALTDGRIVEFEHMRDLYDREYTRAGRNVYYHMDRESRVVVIPSNVIMSASPDCYCSSTACKMRVRITDKQLQIPNPVPTASNTRDERKSISKRQVSLNSFMIMTQTM